MVLKNGLKYLDEKKRQPTRGSTHKMYPMTNKVHRRLMIRFMCLAIHIKHLFVFWTTFRAPMYSVFNSQQSAFSPFRTRLAAGDVSLRSEQVPPWLPVFIKPDGAQGYYLRKLCRPWWEAVPVQEAKRILREQG